MDIGSLLSERARELVLRARGVAAADKSEELNAKHLLAAALQVDATRRMLDEAGVDVERLSQRLGVGATLSVDAAQAGPAELSPSAKRALLDAYQLSRQLGTSCIGPEHILQALAANEESSAGRALAEAAGGRPTSLAAPATHSSEQPRRPSSTPTLDEFGRDLTEQARAGKLDPVIGRDEEVEQTIEVLSRRSKNNPVLIGDPGVGKTAIVEGIAQRITADDVPATLKDKRLIALDLAGMVAGTKYRGEFEERLKKLLEEAGRQNPCQLLACGSGSASGRGRPLRLPAVRIEHLGEGGPASAAGVLDQFSIGRHAQPLAEPHVHMITHEELPSFGSSGPVIVEADRVHRQCRSSHVRAPRAALQDPPHGRGDRRATSLTDQCAPPVTRVGARCPDHPAGFAGACPARAPGCGCGWPAACSIGALCRSGRWPPSARTRLRGASSSPGSGTGRRATRRPTQRRPQCAQGGAPCGV
ncbi:Clp protease N-terminal domain-containing protein [Streptomyces sp. NPDC002144]